jgi:UPF0716 protein FxsA
MFLLPIALLPIAEIIGFVEIGGRIGLLWTFLWLAASTLLGLRLLQGRRKTWEIVQSRHNDEIFVVGSMFDGLCIFIAGVLLIFPGFISDFIALPLLVPPLRRWIFEKMQKNPDSILRRHARKPGESTVIEGEYRRMDDDNHLPMD